MNLVSSEAREEEATAGRRASPLDCFERFVLRTTSFGGRRQSTLKHLPCLTNDSASYGTKRRNRHRGSSHIQPKTSVKDSCCPGQGHVACELIPPRIASLADYYALSSALNGSSRIRASFTAEKVRSNLIQRSLLYSRQRVETAESAHAVARGVANTAA
jgi:hypothetical protein